MVNILTAIKRWLFGDKEKGYLSKDITLRQLKDKWAKAHYPRLSKGGVSGYEFAWKNIPDTLKDRTFVDLKYKDWQDCVDDMKRRGVHHYSQKRIKNICGQLYTFAIKHELVERNFAPLIELSKNKPVRPRVPFSYEKIDLLWQNLNTVKNVDLILMLIYTGVRISEFLRIKTHKDVFLEDRYFIVRESKTEAGRNRPVPIHKRILPLFEKYVAEGNEYLITNYNKGKLSYGGFRSKYQKALKALGLKHTVHECRHTLATMLDDADANDMAIKRILGHAGDGLTKKVYTHKRLEELFKAIDLLK